MCDSVNDLDADDVMLDLPSADSGTIYTFTVGIGQAGRLDKFLADSMVGVSREKIKRSILQGLSTIEQGICTDPSQKVRVAQHVTLNLIDDMCTIEPADLGLEYLYADEAIVVVNKPAGLTVHPCPSCKERTLVHGLVHDFPQLQAMGGLRPGIVHRLDKDTSGVMVVALREDVRLRLAQAFAARHVHKIYLALVHGIPAAEGECSVPIGRHPTQKIKMAVVKDGRSAHTAWKRLYADPEGTFSLLAVTIHTGRTHQIRVHMTHLGHPLVGDSLYTSSSPLVQKTVASRQMLHAWKLSLPDGSQTGIEENVSCETMPCVDFQQSPPMDFIKAAMTMSYKLQRVIITGCAGSGKSTVLNEFEKKGIPACSADALVHALYAPHSVLWQLMISRFGKRIIHSTTQEIDRKFLFQQMLDDNTVREDVNRLVHPFVSAQLEAFFEQNTTGNSPFAMAEVPLWFESSSNVHTKNCVVIGVQCNQAIRYTRLYERRGWNQEFCETMDMWQWPEDEKMRRCNFVIHNNRTVQELNEECTQVFTQIQEAAEQQIKKLQFLIKTL